jgi:cysteine desulfurase
MKNIYLDNAATTPVDPKVIDAMLPYMRDHFGNPSSTHGFGRKAKGGIIMARKTIAKYLNCASSEIVFTSGGTEADNLAICCAVRDMGIKHAITSPLEHKAVLTTLNTWADKGEIKLSIVNLNADGSVDLAHLEELLQTYERSFVSLMHGNNEIANILPIKKVGLLCKEYDAIFHSDTVQTMAHYKFDMQNIHVHFITGAAHKFHGPKGVGFLYVNKEITALEPMIVGGGQESNLRGGTENIYGIVGLAKAFELANEHMEEHKAHIRAIKKYMCEQLKANFPEVEFNGQCESDTSLYTVLSVCMPPSERGDMVLLSLDIQGVAASGGSACSSGASSASHVLQAIGANLQRPNVRFSFGRFTTMDEIDYAVETLKNIYALATA